MNLKLLIISLACCATATTTAQENTWTQKAQLPGPGRLGAAAFSIGSSAYLGTGFINPASVFLKDFWQWDQATNVWTQKADFAGGLRGWTASFAIGTNGYVGLGFDTFAVPQTDFWEYNPTANIWTQKANYGGVPNASKVTESPGFSIGYKGYVIGNMTMELWEYEPFADTWTQRSSYPGSGTEDFVAFSAGGKGYAGLGMTPAPLYTKEFWEYDPTTDTWTRKTDFGGSGRVGCVSFVLGTRGFICTGHDGSSMRNDLWEYQTTTDTWTLRTSGQFGGRWVAAGFAVNNRGDVGTGFIGQGGSAKDLWEYTPLPGLAVVETSVKNDLSVYPNPIITTATIRTDKALHNATLTICNATGQQVRQMQNVSGQDKTIQRDDLPAGVYTISISQEGKNVATGKLVVAD